MTRAICINAACGREFVSSPRLALLTGGLCRSCAADADRVERQCQDCGNSFYEFPKFLAKIGAFAGARVRCPACHDRKIGKDGVNVAEGRKCLGYFPIVRMEIDLEVGDRCPGKDVSGRSPVKVVLRDNWNRSWDGRLDVFDYRPDGERGFGSLATVRVMEVTHAAGHTLEVRSGQVLGPKHTEVLEFSPTMLYLAVEPVEPTHLGKEAETRMVLERTYSKWNASGQIDASAAHWAWTLSSSSRSGRHSSQTVVAIIDEEHPIFVRQDHLTDRVGLTGSELVEAGFRDDVKQGTGLSGFIAFGQPDLCERLVVEGWRAKVVEGGVVVKPRRDAETGLIHFPAVNLEVRLEATEAGGGYTNSGWASCVSGLDGSVLRPYATAGHRGNLACRTHAWFAVAEGLVTAQATWWNKATPPVSVCLHRHSWMAEGPHCGRVHSEL
ncbi:MAG: hypothetical protein KDD69_12280, partial [Bdellovibrionales bacterium]|nr:hypothetical protein [Bdellovibrionales bacterium]